MDFDVADAGRRTHLVAEVALVATTVTHHSLHDLHSDLEQGQVELLEVFKWQLLRYNL